jgi:hypothetical protein
VSGAPHELQTRASRPCVCKKRFEALLGAAEGRAGARRRHGAATARWRLHRAAAAGLGRGHPSRMPSLAPPGAAATVSMRGCPLHALHWQQWAGCVRPPQQSCRRRRCTHAQSEHAPVVSCTLPHTPPTQPTCTHPHRLLFPRKVCPTTRTAVHKLHHMQQQQLVVKTTLYKRCSADVMVRVCARAGALGWWLVGPVAWRCLRPPPSNHPITPQRQPPRRPQPPPVPLNRSTARSHHSMQRR